VFVNPVDLILYKKKKKKEKKKKELGKERVRRESLKGEYRWCVIILQQDEEREREKERCLTACCSVLCIRY
jgi:hypothetical protein